MPDKSIQEKFPNFFSELHKLEASQYDIALVDAFIGSVLSRLQVLHSHEGITDTNQFFKHLCDYAQEQADKIVKRDNGQASDVKVDLYIGGGVVRTMLANMYKAVHAQKAEYDPLSDIRTLYGEDAVTGKSEYSTFEALEGLAAKTEKLASPFVLGVGSDLDIYIQTRLGGGVEGPSTQEQMSYQQKVGNEVAEQLENYVNKLETEAGLYKEKHPIRHGLRPIVTVQEYDGRINQLLEQGGSLLDLLAYKIDPKLGEPGFVYPSGSDDGNRVLRDFLHGFYEYVSPKVGVANPQQTIAGLRPLLEIPFLDVKDQKVIVDQLTKIVRDMREHGAPLDADAEKEFNKMLQNANFQGAGNRAYFDSGSPIGLGLEIADAKHRNKEAKKTGGRQINYLLPEFLQKMPIQSHTEKQNSCEGALYDKMNEHLIDPFEFETKYTTNGFLYHGTSLMAGINILRGGFVMSTDRAGTAAFGAGTYTAKTYHDSAEYAGPKGIVLPLKFAKEKPLNIISKEWVQKNREQLEEEAIQKGYKTKYNTDQEALYSLLRDRKEYAVDIIVATDNYLTIENQEALDVSVDLNVLAGFYESDLRQDPSAEKKAAYDKIVDFLIDFGGDKSKLKTSTQILEDVFSKDFNELINISVADRHNPILLKTIELGLLEYSCKLAQKSVGVEATSEKQETPLHKAVNLNNTELVRMLLQGGSNINATDLYKNTPLLAAVKNNQKDIVKILLDNGADLEQWNTFNINGLCTAISNNNIELFEFLINQNANINSINDNGKSVLYYAVKCENKEFINCLLKYGVDFENKDNNGKTVLHHILADDEPDNLLMLLENGADINAKFKNGATPLMYTIHTSKNECFDVLLENSKLDINAQDRKGDTALMYAAKKGNVDMVKALLKKGATVDAKILDLELSAELKKIIEDGIQSLESKNTRKLIIHAATSDNSNKTNTEQDVSEHQPKKSRPNS